MIGFGTMRGIRSVPARAIATGALMIVGLSDPAARSDFASGEQVSTAVVASSRADVPPLGKPLKGHKGEIYDVAVGKRGDGTPVIVSGDGDGNLSVWDLDTGDRIGGPFTGHTRAIFALAIGKRSDGTPVAISSGLDKTIRVWSLGA
ncbi:hypothetical protein ABZ912_25575 [Nonomuraea angiospora]|uniref:hypothetical protein n=1 Tax=Nonomuraea angiospora TaxID=46172 RepID=UPI0033F9416D